MTKMESEMQGKKEEFQKKAALLPLYPSTSLPLCCSRLL